MESSDLFEVLKRLAARHEFERLYPKLQFISGGGFNGKTFQYAAPR